MKLGFQSAILADLPFEEVIDFAAEEGFTCVELMCWPMGRAERKYAGVTHLDVAGFTAADAERVNSYCKERGIEISALGYYPNPLTPDAEEAEVAARHLRAVIDASALLGVHMVTTFVGNDWNKSVDDNWPRFKAVWGPLLAYAEEKQVKVGIENCAMYFTKDEWPAGKNIAYSPAIWRRMFEEFPTPYFGLNYDPSHFIWMRMDHTKPLVDFQERIVHAHAKDVKIDQARLDEVGIMAYPLDYHDPRIPGRGEIDWADFVTRLKATGYDGALCIEVEDSDYEGSIEDRKRALRESGALLKGCLENA